jgi:hypothetical protein
MEVKVNTTARLHESFKVLGVHEAFRGLLIASHHYLKY